MEGAAGAVARHPVRELLARRLEVRDDFGAGRGLVELPAVRKSTSESGYRERPPSTRKVEISFRTATRLASFSNWWQRNQPFFAQSSSALRTMPVWKSRSQVRLQLWGQRRVDGVASMASPRWRRVDSVWRRVDGVASTAWRATSDAATASGPLGPTARRLEARRGPERRPKTHRRRRRDAGRPPAAPHHQTARNPTILSEPGPVSSESAQIRKKSHPRPSFPETTPVDTMTTARRPLISARALCQSLFPPWASR